MPVRAAVPTTRFTSPEPALISVTPSTRPTVSVPAAPKVKAVPVVVPATKLTGFGRPRLTPPGACKARLVTEMVAPGFWLIVLPVRRSSVL